MDEDKFYEDYYVAQAEGAGLPAYHGLMYQRGAGLGNVLARAARFVIPILQHAGKYIGNKVLKTGKEIATDIVKGTDVKSAVKKRVLDAFDEVKRDASEVYGVPKPKPHSKRGKSNVPIERNILKRSKRLRRNSRMRSPSPVTSSDEYPLLSKI